MSPYILNVPHPSSVSPIYPYILGLGFNIRGGSDAPHLADCPGIFVTSIRPGGVADRDRRLKRGDRLLEVRVLLTLCD